jgi:hypothetical protein
MAVPNTEQSASHLIPDLVLISDSNAGSCRLKAKLHLTKHNLGLAFDRRLDDLPGLKIERPQA